METDNIVIGKINKIDACVKTHEISTKIFAHFRLVKSSKKCAFLRPRGVGVSPAVYLATYSKPF